MLHRMDSLAPSVSTTPIWSPRLPSWALLRGRDIGESDAAFAAGIALKSLDDLIRADPPWLGCWRDRLSLKSAAVSATMLGRNEEEAAIRDAVLLTSPGDDPGPAGKLFSHHTNADAPIRANHNISCEGSRRAFRTSVG
jgi:hypothetical protein